ncbi:universal stress protein [Streptomyces sp. VRA16 Mangrove soil]|uniref:universal stress protein n=1 Tax=Streptomyces sp. VRA16 Mangrove soil TaxID=2817434 RepID=UPI001A9E6501|nr:universal stress protein [Streptomyces sp. VRA16 Mangrove soil]MBO1334419.1 universal stress protein [Streptomyces sp. VRA16 Mangrove soil]
MEGPLIVGIDGSEPSLQALDWAVDEAVRRATALLVVHASRWERYEGHHPSFGRDRGAVQQYAEHIAAQGAERARKRAPELKISTEVVPHDPAAALVEASRDAGVLVVGSRGHGTFAGLLLGGVSLPVAAHAQCPVVVVRGNDKNVQGGLGQVTLGVGAPERASAAAGFAFRAAQTRDATLVALRAWRCPAHELPDYPTEDSEAHVVRAENELTSVLHDPVARFTSVPVSAVPQEGRARDVLVEASALSDLLVVGARRRRTGVGLQLGPVGHAVLHHSACPVAVVPHD